MGDSHEWALGFVGWDWDFKAEVIRFTLFHLFPEKIVPGNIKGYLKIVFVLYTLILGSG